MRQGSRDIIRLWLRRFRWLFIARTVFRRKGNHVDSREHVVAQLYRRDLVAAVTMDEQHATGVPVVFAVLFTGLHAQLHMFSGHREFLSGLPKCRRNDAGRLEDGVVKKVILRPACIASVAVYEWSRSVPARRATPQKPGFDVELETACLANMYF